MFKFFKKSHSVSVIGSSLTPDFRKNDFDVVFYYIENRLNPPVKLLLNKSFFCDFFSEVSHRSYYSDETYYLEQSDRCVYFLYYYLFKEEKFSFVDSPSGLYPVRILKSY